MHACGGKRPEIIKRIRQCYCYLLLADGNCSSPEVCKLPLAHKNFCSPAVVSAAGSLLPLANITMFASVVLF